MSVATLLEESTHETIIPVRWPALAGGAPTGNAVLALDLGQKTGWAVRNTDGAIASGTVVFRPSRWEGGGMVFLRFRAWLQEVDETAGGVGAVYFEEVSTAERRCIAVAEQECVRGRDEKGPARPKRHRAGPCASLLVALMANGFSGTSDIDALAASMLMSLACHVDFAAACLAAPYDNVPDAGHVT